MRLFRRSKIKVDPLKEKINDLLRGIEVNPIGDASIAAHKELSKLGKEAVPAMLTLLNNKAYGVGEFGRSELLILIAKYPAPEVLETISENLLHEYACVRCAALNAILKIPKEMIGNLEIREEIKKLRKDKEWEVRELADKAHNYIKKSKKKNETP